MREKERERERESEEQFVILHSSLRRENCSNQSQPEIETGR